MGSFYLHVVDFYIKLTFIKPKYTLFLRDKLQREIMMLFRDFVVFKKPEVIDYYIEFKETNIVGLISDSHSKLQFVSLYEQKDVNKIRTDYSISTSQFHYIIKEVLSELIKDKGFFQHASSVLNNQKAYIFLGKSGSGKSTISSFLSKKYLQLADDVVMIKKNSDYYECYQSPFWERNWWTTKNSSSYPLAKIFFLKKSRNCKIEQIHSKKKILDLLLSDLTYEQVYLQKKMNIFLDFIANFSQFYYLYFPKNEKEVISYFEKERILT